MENIKTETTHLPDESKFDDEVKSVTVRMEGKERILSPKEITWDSFFNSTESVSDDFMNERAKQE